MMFPKAYAGVKKVFTGEILELIGSVLMMIGIMLGAGLLATVQSGGEETVAAGTLALGAVSLIMPATIILLIGEIMVLVGLKQAGDDEPVYMRKAFWAALLVIVASIVVSFVSNSMTNDAQNSLNSVLNIVDECISVFVFVFSIQGISQLARNIGGYDHIVAFGNRLCVGLTIGIIAMVVAIVAANYVGVAAAIVALVILVLVYLSYLVFLSRAKEMLVRS